MLEATMLEQGFCGEHADGGGSGSCDGDTAGDGEAVTGVWLHVLGAGQLPPAANV